MNQALMQALSTVAAGQATPDQATKTLQQAQQSNG